MKLRELRLKYKITQNELAKILGVSGQTILNWENGIHEPKIQQLIALADLFRISVDELIEHKTSNSRVEIVCQELERIPKDRWISFIREALQDDC